MNRKIFSIWSVLLVLVISIAVVVPGCTGDGDGDGDGDGACTGKIEVNATRCDAPWEGDVQYMLIGPGATASTVIIGTNVTALFDNVYCGNWTCVYISGGPADADLADITTSPTQEVSDGNTITFTLNFERGPDAWIDFDTWTIDGIPWPISEVDMTLCQIIDVHFVQGVLGCEGRIDAVNETSRLWIHFLGFTDTHGVLPQQPHSTKFDLHVVNDDCAVNKTAEPPANPPEKVSQDTTYWGEYVPPSTLIPLPWCEETELDVETIWMLEEEIDYVKSINWLGYHYDPGMHECVLFDLLIRPPIPPSGYYVFLLVAEAEVALMDDEDVNTQNNKAVSPPLLIWLDPF